MASEEIKQKIYEAFKNENSEKAEELIERYVKSPNDLYPVDQYRYGKFCFEKGVTILKDETLKINDQVYRDKALTYLESSVADYPQDTSYMSLAGSEFVDALMKVSRIYAEAKMYDVSNFYWAKSVIMDSFWGKNKRLKQLFQSNCHDAGEELNRLNRQGLGLSFLFTGERYELGIEIEQNYDNALLCYENAYSSSDTTAAAAFRLGELYYKVTFPGRNLDKAKKYFNEAKQNIYYVDSADDYLLQIEQERANLQIEQEEANQPLIKKIDEVSDTINKHDKKSSSLFNQGLREISSLEKGIEKIQNGIEEIKTQQKSEIALLEGLSDSSSKSAKNVSDAIEKIKNELDDLSEKQKKTIQDATETIIQNIQREKEEIEAKLEESYEITSRKIAEKFSANYLEKQNSGAIDGQILDDCQKELQKCLGTLYKDLTDYSKQSLVSALVFLKQSSDLGLGDSIDYSGVVIAATSALEEELKIRFFKPLIKYFKDNNLKIESLPESLYNHLYKEYFHIGDVSYILDNWDYKKEEYTGVARLLNSYIEGLFNDKVLKKLKKLNCNIGKSCDFLTECTLKIDQSTTINESFVTRCNSIKDSYRNKAAHTESVPLDLANDCLESLLEYRTMNYSDARHSVGATIGLIKLILEWFKKPNASLFVNENKFDGESKAANSSSTNDAIILEEDKQRLQPVKSNAQCERLIPDVISAMNNELFLSFYSLNFDAMGLIDNYSNIFSKEFNRICGKSSPIFTVAFFIQRNKSFNGDRKFRNQIKTILGYINRCENNETIPVLSTPI